MGEVSKGRWKQAGPHSVVVKCFGMTGTQMESWRGLERLDLTEPQYADLENGRKNGESSHLTGIW